MFNSIKCQIIISNHDSIAEIAFLDENNCIFVIINKKNSCCSKS